MKGDKKENLLSDIDRIRKEEESWYRATSILNILRYGFETEWKAKWEGINF